MLGHGRSRSSGHWIAGGECRRRVVAERLASCSMEQSLTSAGDVLVDDEGWSWPGIVGSEYVAENKQ